MADFDQARRTVRWQHHLGHQQPQRPPPPSWPPWLAAGRSSPCLPPRNRRLLPSVGRSRRKSVPTTPLRAVTRRAVEHISCLENVRCLRVLRPVLSATCPPRQQRGSPGSSMEAVYLVFRSRHEPQSTAARKSPNEVDLVRFSVLSLWKKPLRGHVDSAGEVIGLGACASIKRTRLRGMAGCWFISVSSLLPPTCFSPRWRSR